MAEKAAALQQSIKLRQELVSFYLCFFDVFFMSPKIPMLFCHSFNCHPFPSLVMFFLFS